MKRPKAISEGTQYRHERRYSPWVPVILGLQRSVDLESDALIQQTLQHKLGGTTVLTIAHRLETIMHCDRVVVMDAGKVAEEGPPLEMRERKGSRFCELWEAHNEAHANR